MAQKTQKSRMKLPIQTVLECRIWRSVSRRASLRRLAEVRRERAGRQGGIGGQLAHRSDAYRMRGLSSDVSRSPKRVASRYTTPTTIVADCSSG